MHQIIYLSREHVEKVGLGMAEIVEDVEKAFLEKGKGYAAMPPKHWIELGNNAFLSAMSGYLINLKAAACKWQSGSPDNPGKGLPYLNGLLIVNEAETGLPLAIMDSTWVTAMRTAAATAVAAKYLAKNDSSAMAMIGCGVQGRTNVEAMLVVFPKIEQVRAYDVDKNRLERFANEMMERFNIRVNPCENPKAAVEESDIIVTATPILKHPSPVIEASWVRKGALGVALEYDSYWKPEAIRSMNKLCTDDVSQVIHLQSFGYFPGIPPFYAEIGDIVSRKKRGREKEDEKILTMNLGVAIEDVATGLKIYRLAEKKGIGIPLPL